MFSGRGLSMRRLPARILLTCLILIAADLSVTAANIDNPFGKIGGWIKHLLVKRKPIVCYVASVEKVYLNENVSTADEPRRLAVSSEIIHGGDVLVYMYKVTGGKIIGEGANVTWDLSNAPAGQYSITVGVDDGCGVCGNTVTRHVVVFAAEARPPRKLVVCPVARIKPNVFSVRSGEVVAFHAVFDRPEDAKRALVWSISAGEIFGGQNTDTLFVTAADKDIEPKLKFANEPTGCEYPMFYAVQVKTR
jgi:hypothetical protein